MRLAAVALSTGLVALCLGGRPAVAAAQPLEAPLLDAALQQRVVAAWQGFERGDPQPAQDALPAMRGKLLEPWVAYWALQPTVTRMTEADFDAFARAYPGTYVLDRLRDDWLLELGQRQDWTTFAAVYPGFVMRDDPQVECYELQRRFEVNGEDTSAALWPVWLAQKGGGAGCNSAARSLVEGGRLDTARVWLRVRRFFEDGQYKTAAGFAPQLPVGAWRLIDRAAQDPVPVLLHARQKPLPPAGMARERIVLALLRLAQQDPTQARQMLRHDFAGLPQADRAEVAFALARAAAQQLMPEADAWYLEAVAAAPQLPDDRVTLEWMARAALRAHDWPLVEQATTRLTAGDDPPATWVYWRAIAQRRQGHVDSADGLLRGIAVPWNYYGQLATEALGESVRVPAAPQDPTPQLLRAAAADHGLQRALALMRLSAVTSGIWVPAAREWNFTLLHRDVDQLHAAAQLACDRQAWMLCINTSTRMKDALDWRLGYAMPYRGIVDRAAASSGVDEAFLYGLIRQESRFAADIRSWAGANGLMQLMPTTAAWVAHKVGMTDYDASRIADPATNVALGSAYLGLLLQRFSGSQALAAAGYNAGPGRPARWRTTFLAQDPAAVPATARALTGAIFAECIPIAETRDYVERVLANATIYAALLSGEPQSLESRLGAFGAEPSAQVAAEPLP